MSGSEPARRALTSSALRARQREERAGGSSGLVIQPTTARSKGRYRERRKKKTKKYILARIQALQPVSPPLPPSPTPFYTTHSPSLFSYIPRSSFTSHIHKLPLYALLYLSVSPSRAGCERTYVCTRVRGRADGREERPDRKRTPTRGVGRWSGSCEKKIKKIGAAGVEGGGGGRVKERETEAGVKGREK